MTTVSIHLPSGRPCSRCPLGGEILPRNGDPGLVAIGLVETRDEPFADRVCREEDHRDTGRGCFSLNQFIRSEQHRLRDRQAQSLRGLEVNDQLEVRRLLAFLAQQTVEKYLKGVWVVLKREPAPHTHSLTELGDGVGVPPELRRDLADLTPDYTVSRYPNAANAVPYELYDDATARAKIGRAERVIRWLRERIPR